MVLPGYFRFWNEKSDICHQWGGGENKKTGPLPNGNGPTVSVIRWEERGNRSALIVFDKPKGFRFVGIFEDLKVVESVLFNREELKLPVASKY